MTGSLFAVGDHVRYVRLGEWRVGIVEKVRQRILIEIRDAEDHKTTWRNVELHEVIRA